MRTARVRRTSIFVPFAALTLLAALAGCAGSDDPGPPSPTPAAASGSPAGTSGSPAGTSGTTGSTTPKVVLERSGGFAGLHETTTVEPDGSWSTRNRTGVQRTGSIAEDQLARWRERTTDPRLAGEAGRSPAASRCADTFNYRLTVGPHVISYVDCPGEPGQPPAATSLVELLTGVTG